VHVRIRVPCSWRARCAPTPRLPRLRSPPGLPTLTATLDLSELDADDDGPATGSPAVLRTGEVVELELLRTEEGPAGILSPSVGSLKRLTGDGRPSTDISASLLSAISRFRPSPPADDRGGSRASRRDRRLGTRRLLSLAIKLPQGWFKRAVTVRETL